jgi:hemerythrin-like domain-containing protein
MQNPFTSLLTIEGPAQRRRGSERSPTADIRELIRRDHEELLGLVGRLCEARSATARSRLLKQLSYAAPAHDKPEERTVYAALKGATEKSADIAHEGKVEHELVSGLLKKLSRMRDPASRQAKAHADVLQELLEHHIEEEHSEMFEQLERDFDAGERIAMGAAFVAAKEAYARQHRMRKPARKPARKAASQRPAKRA